MRKGIPKAGWSYEEVIKWLQLRDFPTSNKAWQICADIFNKPAVTLIKDALGNSPEQDIDLTLVTSSKRYGPLTPTQKEEIYKHHRDAPTISLAHVYMTNPQNIRLAKRGAHLQQTAPEMQAPDMTHITPNAKYGPLSVEQKIEIHLHHQGEKASYLATLYNTNAQNVRIALNTPPEHWS